MVCATALRSAAARRASSSARASSTFDIATARRPGASRLHLASLSTCSRTAPSAACRCISSRNRLAAHDSDVMTTARTRHGHSTRRHRSRHTKITRTLTISHFGSLHTGGASPSEGVADLLALLRLVVPVRREPDWHVAVRDGARPLHGSALPAEHVDRGLRRQADELGRLGGVLAEVLPGDAALRELAEKSLRGA